LINVESDRNNFDSLRYVTQSWEAKDVTINMHGEFGNLVPQIVSQIKDSPAFFFVDPFGSTAVKFSHLRPILERTQRATELIINFDADGLRRIGDTLNSRANNPTTLKARQTNVANLTEIIGSDHWKAKFEAGNLTAKDRERVLLDEYIKTATTLP
jgi:three-Cys-motif partner protein